VAVHAIVGLPAGRVDESTTINVGLIEGGSALNVVPDRAVVWCEVRSLKRERVDSLVRELRTRFRACADEAGAGLDFEMPWEFEPYEITDASPTWRRAAGAIEWVGLVPQSVASCGASDANVLNARGIPTINLGIGAENPHAENEFIQLENLAAAPAIARELMQP
jgi:tripeptide aminopeptidase